MIERKKVLVIAETHLGVTAEIAEYLGWDLVSFTFRPSFYSVSTPIKKIEEDTHVPVSIVKNFKFSSYGDSASSVLVEEFFGDPVSMIKAFVENQKEECIIFFLHDADEGGDIMSSFLRYHLKVRGVASERMIRVAGLEIREDMLLVLEDNFFYSDEHLRLVLERVRDNQYSMNVFPRIGVGLRKAAAIKAIKEALETKEVVTNINLNGSGMSTFVTKYLLDEEL